MKWLAIAALSTTLVASSGCQSLPNDPISVAKRKARNELRSKCMKHFGRDGMPNIAYWEGCDRWARRQVP